VYRTAEFVSPKHPDKICDRISDRILDYCLDLDPNSRVAVETMGGHGFINVNGEVTINTEKELPINDLVKEVVEDDYRIQVKLVQQSPEIGRGVDTGGAGDQGIMVGYACDENDEMVPQEYYLARDLCRYIYNVWSSDGKTQVTIDEDHNIVAIVCSFQNLTYDELHRLVYEWLEDKGVNPNSVARFCNPAGDWEQGGFDADAGLTGRKLVVDNYGPRVPIGGGAYSGKDPSKVDRSAAYMARHIAKKELIRKGCSEVWVYLSYGIGMKEPLQSTATDGETYWDISDAYPVHPNEIIDFLDLKKPIYYKTSEWGAYGNGFKWDK
jgi:S-adenosylmethionine synthetase